jgi:hypothetical protein
MKPVPALCAVLVLALLCFLAPGAARAQGWGKEIKGTVIYDGAPRQPEVLNVNQDQAHCLSKGPILSADWIINKTNKGLKNVFVWLEPVKKDDKLPIHPARQAVKPQEVIIDQPCCMFLPNCLALRQGQVIVVKNPSPVIHNFRWGGGPKNPGGNVNIPSKSSYKVNNLVAEDLFPVFVNCDIHKWMTATIKVFDHPYFALTDENGAFAFPDPPAGAYRLKIWHRGGGYPGGAQGKGGLPITVTAGETTDIGTVIYK